MTGVAQALSVSARLAIATLVGASAGGLSVFFLPGGEWPLAVIIALAVGLFVFLALGVLEGDTRSTGVTGR